MGQLRGALQAALPGDAYRAVLAIALALSAAGLIGYAVVRIRIGRGARYVMLCLGLAVAVAYAWLTASGNANVDLVERIHFVEYGVLALLFFRAWRARQDAAALLAPVLACIIVAVLDEWLQWFVPGRVGEFKDVALDTVAVGCGLLFALALMPPATWSAVLSRGSAGLMAMLAMALLVVGGLAFDTVHLGHELTLDRTTWRSRYTAAELDALQRERWTRWATDPPLVLHRMSREDQYLAEGIWHVQRRNESASSGDARAAWRENLILERYFAPVLDTPSYQAPAPSRWPAEQRQGLSTRAANDRQIYLSTAPPFPLVIWSRTTMWALVLAGAAGIAWCWRRSVRQTAGRSAPAIGPAPHGADR